MSDGRGQRDDTKLLVRKLGYGWREAEREGGREG